MSDIGFPIRPILRFAWRDLCGSIKGLRIAGACLALGVAALATVGLLHSAVETGLHANGAQMLGGDLEIDSGEIDLPQAARQWLTQHGGRLSSIVTMRSMLVAPNGDRMLVDLKAVDRAYPLVGRTVLQPNGSLQTLLAEPALVADPLVMQRLALHPGDHARVGNAVFRVAASLTAEPDRSLTLLHAPSVIVGAASLPQTGLVQPGSMITHRLRIIFPTGHTIEPIRHAFLAAFPDHGWRVLDAGDAAPSVARFFDQIASFMTLSSLVTLLIGGIGAGMGVATWLDRKTLSVGILRSFGASSRTIFAIFLLQLIGLTLASIGLGLTLALIVTRALAPYLSEWFGLPATLTMDAWQPLWVAALSGCLLAGAFSIPALMQGASIRPTVLFRAALSHDTRRSWGAQIGSGIALLPLIGLTAALSAQPRFVVAFWAVALCVLAILFGAAHPIRAFARYIVANNAVSGAAVRLGLGRIARAGSAGLLLVSVGLGLTALVTVAAIAGNLRQTLAQDLPAHAPSFFFIDLQNDQLGPFQALLQKQSGIGATHIAPSLRARIVAVKNIAADAVPASQDTKWALRGDRGLTIAATLPNGNRLISGKWWPPDYQGPPLLSLDSGLAKGWHVQPGDTIRLNILGRSLDMQVANIREVSWRSLGLNFSLVASPGLLSGAPHTNIATVQVPSSQDGAILKAVSDAFPNVTGLHVADFLATVAQVIAEIEAALAIVGGVSLLSGSLVLASAIAAQQQRRVYEDAILRANGATSAQLRLAWLVEFGSLGVAAGVTALILGEGASWIVMRFAMHERWQYLPWIPFGTLAGAVTVITLWGGIAGESGLRANPHKTLRSPD